MFGIDRIFYLSLFSACVALACLSGCKENARTAIPRLKKELTSSDTHTRNTAALALAAYGKDAEPAVPALIQLLSDPNGGVKSSAAYALRAIGGEQAESALERATAKKN